ncbi:TBC1 domain family member 25 [Caerostris extrusa]|uniref:TBC1 domain family member 25 n=1 Tax=Caerostris extrusa TaxID=172846 RepID=A0AAV4PF03_CAEEX|nr:TBC1 domain family member 25 [Caerostris extrusa]
MELENLNRQLPGSFLQRSITIDSEDLDSPRSRFFESTRDNLKYHQPLHNIDQTAEEEASESWTSDDLSGMDQICRLGSTKKSHKHPEYLHLNGSDGGEDPTYCCTPDEQFDIDFDVQVKSSSDIPCNGEILENEESEDKNGCACHLKSVIPIRLVHSPGIDNRFQRHGSDSSDSLSESCPGRIETDEYMPLSIQNAGCGSENNITKERLLLDEKNYRKKTVLQNSIDVMSNSCIEALEYSIKNQKASLPSPCELGGGNPFMLFLCLTLLLQHRDIIMKSHMDYNELAMHFDKMVRKHNVHRVLHQARAMFREYLQMSCQEQDSDPYV